MSLPRFLDCATTMLYEEFQRVGQSAFDAFDQVRGWSEGGDGVVAVAASGAGVAAPPPPEKIDNARSMEQFMGLLKGVGGMPG